MKKVFVIGLLSAFLMGCAAQPLETVSDAYVEQVPAIAQRIMLDLPEEAAQPVMESQDGEQLFLCSGYELRVQTLNSGNLSDVISEVTGYTQDQLTLIETGAGKCRRYDCSWCTVGEEGELVGRTAILDDGNYCYCVTALAKSEDTYDLQQEWQQVFSSIELRQY